MKIESLRHRIRIQQRQILGAAEKWADLVSVWSAIEPLSAKEKIDRADIEQSVTHKITIRYRKGITSTMRVVYKERIFSIESVLDPTERREMLHLICEELPPLLDEITVKRQQKVRGPRNEAILRSLPVRQINACVMDVQDAYSHSDPVLWTRKASIYVDLGEDVKQGDTIEVNGRGEFFVTEVKHTKNFLLITAQQEQRGAE